MHTRAACSHCMQERKSGFRFQNAEGQRHAAVVAERKLRPQMTLVHPLGAAARKAVFRRAAFQPDSLYLTERKGACKAGAGRFEEGFLRGEIRRRTGGFMSAEGGRISLRKPQRLPLRRAEDPGRKGGAMGAAEAFCHPGSVAEVAADAVYHDMPLFCKNSFADLHDKIGKI